VNASVETGTADVFAVVDGDVDSSGTVDLEGLAGFQLCFGEVLGPSGPTACTAFDFVLDETITLAGWVAMELRITSLLGGAHRTRRRYALRDHHSQRVSRRP
jgi:hypothetical protein